MADSEEKLDQILNLMAGIAEHQRTSDERLDTLAEQVAQLASLPADVPYVKPDISHIVFQQAPVLSPLVELDADNAARRTNLAVELGILGQPLGEQLVRYGARGFYRAMDRMGMDPTQPDMRRDTARRLVEDAMLEDPAEAAEMGQDLLLVIDDDDPADIAARAPWTVAVVG